MSLNEQDNAVFRSRLKLRAAQVEARLEAALSPAQTAKPVLSCCYAWPERLLAAMRHGVFSGGKRLRPFLLMESAAMLAQGRGTEQQTEKAALEAAAALEVVHCYSLIHDDLPPIDNDDWRRGRPTVHKAYDEATALLAGNALFALGFALINGADNGLSAEVKAALSWQMAQISGAGGMIGGQLLDISAEKQQRSAEDIIKTEMMKTATLLHFACAGGALIAGASTAEQEIMGRFGDSVGFLYQLADDLLDISGDAAILGKALGRDAARGKATFVSLYGEGKSRILLREKLEETQNILAPFGEKAAILRQTAQFVALRDH